MKYGAFVQRILGTFLTGMKIEQQRTAPTLEILNFGSEAVFYSFFCVPAKNWLKSNWVEIQILPGMCGPEWKVNIWNFRTSLPSCEQTQFVFNPNCLRAWRNFSKILSVTNFNALVVFVFVSNTILIAMHCLGLPFLGGTGVYDSVWRRQMGGTFQMLKDSNIKIYEEQLDCWLRSEKSSRGQTKQF